MKPLCYAAALCLIAVPVTAAPAPTPKATNYKEKIVGVWELVKAVEGVPPGTRLEFTRDGKIKMSAKVGGASISLDGTYSVVGDKITMKMKGPDGKEESDTATIIKLTDTELHLKDAMGTTGELKRKKGK